jgi:hypothetical protein
MDNSPKKSRDIPLADLYSNLQLEYISYFLRSKTYRRDFSISYKEVCRVKKEKIDKISSRNNLPSIFNDEDAKKRYLDKFFNETGIPNFTYKDIEIRDKMSCWDKYYYFQRGSSVRFNDNSVVLIGQITKNDKDNSIVSIVDENNTEREFHYNNISRIFSENFFNF